MIALQLGVENGATETAASFIISVSGIFDIFGRFFFGLLFDFKYVRPYRRLLHGVLGLFLGVSSHFVKRLDKYDDLL